MTNEHDLIVAGGGSVGDAPPVAALMSGCTMGKAHALRTG
jgi:hypothetical protein